MLFRSEALLGKVVQDGMNAIWGTDEQALVTFKAKFTQYGKGSASSGSQGNGSSSTLGSTPPTGSVQDLILFASLKPFVNKIHSIDKSTDYKDVRASLMKAMAPIKELVIAAKRRSEAIATRKKSFVTGDKHQKTKPKVAGPTVPFIL